MAITIAPPPIQDSVIELGDSKERKNPFFMAKAWIIWILQSLIPRVQATTQLLKTLSLVGQHASIAVTAIPMAVLTTGNYRVTWYMRVTTPAGVASDVTPTFGWTDGGIAQSMTGGILNGNTTASTDGGDILIAVDGATAITYSTVYNSNPAAAMQYKLTIQVEQVS